MLSGSGVGLGVALVFRVTRAAGFAWLVWFAVVFESAFGLAVGLGVALGCTIAPWPPLAFERTIGSSFCSF